MSSHVLLGLLEKAHLSQETIEHLSVKTGFIQRCRKIKALPFLVYMITESIRGPVSCNDLAAAVEADTGTLASRQAFHRKMNEAALAFFGAVLAVLLQTKTSICPQSPFQGFGRILVQDSTLLALPSRLMTAFSGVKNAHGQSCHARIQSVYDLLGGVFTQWSIHPYRQNDQSVAGQLQVQAGDLVLRDRGYSTTGEFERIRKAGADFISRYKHWDKLYDPATGEPLDLCRLLSRQATIDQIVLLGKVSQTPVRLVAAPVPQEVADRRRYKAKKETKGHQPGHEVLFLMGWTIFVTSLMSSRFAIEDFMALYGLRWRIEIIFKSWKSHLGFDKIHTVSAVQLRLILTARFIAAVLFYERIYVPLARQVHQAGRSTVSLVKLIRYLSRNLKAIPALLSAVAGNPKGLQVAIQYCTYDKRKRQNFIEKKSHALARFNQAPLS